jgi:asparagine synthase (glutamine-hydrolysing)
MARITGAEAVLDGGGGDNVFCSLQSAAPVADRLLRGGLGPASFRTARDIALLTETGLFRVVALAIRRSLRRSPRFRWETDDRFLTPNALARAGPPSHGWLEAPASALPGSAAHIAMMAVVESLLETADGDIPEWAPLMNQPLVELCLSIPSWFWFEDGHNRVIARRAFAKDLPREIIWRRSKGSPDGFVARLFEANRAGLRDLLCDGRLAGEGLIDRDAVHRALARPGPVKGHDHIRLLRIADVEAWVRGL